MKKARDWDAVRSSVIDLLRSDCGEAGHSEGRCGNASCMGESKYLTGTGTTKAPTGAMTTTRLIAEMKSVALPPLNPYQLGLRPLVEINSMKVVESPDRPRYTLPAEVIPGVPWPPGFREEFNHWSVGFLGTTNVVPNGMAYVLAGGSMLVMRPQDIVKLQTINCT